MVVCHCFNVDAPERAVLETLQASGHTLTLHTGSITPDTATQFADAEVLSFLSYDPLGPAVLDQLPQLKLVATRTTGYNHIDLSALRQRGIALCNLVDYSTVAVAEQAMGLIVALARGFAGQWQETQTGLLSRRPVWMGMELAGKTLGVWGTGATGQALLQRARGFDMRLLATSRSPSQQLADTLGFTQVPLGQLLAQSDFLSLHVALTPDTQNRLNAQAFASMKPGSYLINTARGGLVDSAALLAALETGHLAGAALDVLPTEPILLSVEQRQAVTDGTAGDAAQKAAMLTDIQLMQHPKVLMTPHTAYYTQEAVVRMAQQTVANIEAFLLGQTLRRLV
jgi:D-lactate dehydrogenase